MAHTQNTTNFRENNQSKFEIFLGNLRQEILSGHLKPKERLIEEDISKRFDVSRGPLREALRTLESEGLVEIVPRKGTFVSDANIEDIEAIFQIRILLEKLGIKLACQNMTEEGLARLSGVLDEMSFAVQKNDGNYYFELNKKFHAIIYEHMHNKYLVKILPTMAAQSYRYRLIPVFFYRKLSTMKQRYKKHLELFEALENKDEKTAAMIRSKQIATSARTLKEIVSTYYNNNI